MTDQENNLVGCVNPGSTSKLCADLPNVTSRFVTAVAKGEPHHWASLGGDAQTGQLSTMFDGPRVDSSYDPMQKQGAIVLGNGGDNSNSAQGTFYEGVMTAGYPSDATDQKVQANVVAARYDVQQAEPDAGSRKPTPRPGSTFAPQSSQESTVTFTNTTGSPAVGVKLSISVPSRRWTSVVLGTTNTSVTFPHPVAPGASVSATFRVTSGPAAFNGDLTGNASWTSPGQGGRQSATTAEKVRNVRPIKINEFQRHTSTNPTTSFIELYNSGASTVDLSQWSLTEHPAQQPIFSTVTVPAGTKLAGHHFYLLAWLHFKAGGSARATPPSTSVTRLLAALPAGPDRRFYLGRETRTIARITKSGATGPGYRARSATPSSCPETASTSICRTASSAGCTTSRSPRGQPVRQLRLVTGVRLRYRHQQLHVHAQRRWRPAPLCHNHQWQWCGAADQRPRHTPAEHLVARGRDPVRQHRDAVRERPGGDQQQHDPHPRRLGATNNN